jgi:hypothetical protein
MSYENKKKSNAFGDQGGFFEKPPPWTPRKTFYSPSGGWFSVI